MKRLFVLVIAAVVLCGCRNQAPPAVDPFFGRTRVPPPPTGSLSGRRAAPYYRGASRAMAPLRSIVPTPAGGSTTAEPAGEKLARGEPVIRVLQPRPKAAASSSHSGVSHSAVALAASRPRRLRIPQKAIDIMDLPTAGGSASPKPARSASGSSGFRLVSGTEGPNDSEKVTVADGSSGSAAAGEKSGQFAPRGSYGHDPEYGWLRGKLEHSQIDRHWKLRYIPIDGATDKFGGSVVLSNPSVLAGCERGHFIEARGKLGAVDPKKGFAPLYQVAEVKRLSKPAP